jgi:hypothetical protein
MNRSPLALALPLPEPSPEVEDRTLVVAEDVERIQVLCDLLLALNDPAASARTIAKYVEQYPVLRARIEVRYRQRCGDRALPRPASQIATLGNRELEVVLLQLLEDIVTFHCDRQAARP